MIVVMRTGQISTGVLGEDAYGWALKVTAYVNENFGMNAQVYRNIGGNISEIHWVSTYDSLAKYEELSPKIGADAGYQALIKEATEACLYQSGVTDKIYASVE